MRVALPLTIVLIVCRSAAAQGSDPTGRWSVDVSGGARAAVATVSDHFAFPQNLEIATADLTYRGKAGALVDVGIGYRFWKRLGAGIAIAHAAGDSTAEVNASIPHPFAFNRPRIISGMLTGVARAETNVHVQIRYQRELSSRLRLTLMAGPSILHVTQALATDVQYDETYPYDAATYRTSTRRSSKGSAAGFNVGVDGTWMFRRRIGAGAFVRGAKGRLTLPTADARRIKVQGGGVQGGAGLRLVF